MIYVFNSVSDFGLHFNLEVDAGNIVRISTTASLEEENVVYSLRSIIRGKYPISLAESVPNTMNVYTDLCEQCIVGNVEAQLFRVVPVDVDTYSFGRIKHNNFSPLRYIPVLRKNFQTIEIDIRDHLNQYCLSLDLASNVTLQTY